MFKAEWHGDQFMKHNQKPVDSKSVKISIFAMIGNLNWLLKQLSGLVNGNDIVLITLNFSCNLNELIRNILFH